MPNANSNLSLITEKLKDSLLTDSAAIFKSTPQSNSLYESADIDYNAHFLLSLNMFSTSQPLPSPPDYSSQNHTQGTKKYKNNGINNIDENQRRENVPNSNPDPIILPILPPVWFQFLSAMSVCLYKSGENLRDLYLRMERVGLIHTNLKTIESLLGESCCEDNRENKPNPNPNRLGEDTKLEYGRNDGGLNKSGVASSPWLGAADYIISEVLNSPPPSFLSLSTSITPNPLFVLNVLTYSRILP
jgi:hypothetical protein